MPSSVVCLSTLLKIFLDLVVPILYTLRELMQFAANSKLTGRIGQFTGLLSHDFYETFLIICKNYHLRL